MASSASGAIAEPPSKNPFTTSLTVPSPPTATTRRGPPRRPARASSVAWPGRSVRTVSASTPSDESVPASFSQSRPTAPLRAAGLTITSGRSVIPSGEESAARIASSVMRSTAARISSSEMRTNSPSTTTSDTVRRQPDEILRSALIVKSADASISTARMPRSDQRWYWPPSGL